ncbi:uncharacterized protein LY89DRAFT_681012 [Mollisia scopiformis]|uniref:Uncharacterized protein n=1 Tax=Mollisia scopiformis TaxID=149040 RepID=A0A194XP64_MOLSC|nr:uncharacterized protein LY89DRAFT_681012 [Mollisia scopiformis]KUJ21527.1 hypothetical protein LY89DRAFT_681012 [Mollisia scopiformis]
MRACSEQRFHIMSFIPGIRIAMPFMVFVISYTANSPDCSSHSQPSVWCLLSRTNCLRYRSGSTHIVAVGDP